MHSRPIMVIRIGRLNYIWCRKTPIFMWQCETNKFRCRTFCINFAGILVFLFYLSATNITYATESRRHIKNKAIAFYMFLFCLFLLIYSSEKREKNVETDVMYTEHHIVKASLFFFLQRTLSSRWMAHFTIPYLFWRPENTIGKK